MQLLTPHYDFYMWENKKIYLWRAWHTYSCCHYITNFTSGKKKLVCLLVHLQLLPRHYNFYKQKKENEWLQPAQYSCSCCLCAIIFMSKKTKTNIYNQLQASFCLHNTISATCWAGTSATVALMLWFLQSKKRKQVFRTSLTTLQLLLPHYNFYK